MFTFYRNSPAITIVSYSEKSCRISRTAPTFRRFSACFVPPSRTYPVVPHPRSRHMSFSRRHIFRHFAQAQPLLFAFPTASSPPNTQNRPRVAAAGPVFLTYSHPWPHRLRQSSSRTSPRPWFRAPADTPPRPPAGAGTPSGSPCTARRRCR